MVDTFSLCAIVMTETNTQGLNMFNYNAMAIQLANQLNSVLDQGIQELSQFKFTVALRDALVAKGFTADYATEFVSRMAIKIQVELNDEALNALVDTYSRLIFDASVHFVGNGFTLNNFINMAPNFHVDLVG